MITPFDLNQLHQLYQPPANAHKGENGRVLVVGGSELFHASIFWSADIASRVVDLVHFTSPAAENVRLVRQKAKAGFWDGIVIDWNQIDEYIAEDDCILIGPGMPRPEGLAPGETPTADIVNDLLTRFPEKRWVIDGGALQEIDPKLLGSSHIITPHQGEWQRVIAKTLDQSQYQVEHWDDVEARAAKMQQFVADHGCTVLAKGVVDLVCSPESCMSISGGNPGLSKGGTGDVLAGLTAALYARNDAVLSAAAASCLLKTAADQLHDEVGTMYNTSDLVRQLQHAWKTLV